jgi:magnesium chelatase accessory protein
MSERPVWERDGRDWPNREASRFVRAAGLRWHVQRLGSGPVALLVHGTGAATHSWRGLAPLLARHFTVVAPDLPGHGFTGAPPPGRMSLPGMAEALTALLRALDLEPALAVGHSAGAAVLARMVLDGAIIPRALVSLNGALLPLRGVPGRVFSPMAKLLAATPLVPRVFAWRAGDRAAVERLIRSTGSALDPAGTDYYARLVRSAGHVGATLEMMANWDLEPLERDLPRLEVPLTLVVGGNDRTVRPSEARRVKALVASADIVTLPGLGHLAHEERPEKVAELIVKLAGKAGVPG